jgi:hypothetical protein
VVALRRAGGPPCSPRVGSARGPTVHGPATSIPSTLRGGGTERRYGQRDLLEVTRTVCLSGDSRATGTSGRAAATSAASLKSRIRRALRAGVGGTPSEEAMVGVFASLAANKASLRGVWLIFAILFGCFP